MGQQTHKRLPKDFVGDLIRTFCEEKISRERASEFLGLSKAQFYQLRERYLACRKGAKEFKLYNKKRQPFRFHPQEEDHDLQRQREAPGIPSINCLILNVPRVSLWLFPNSHFGGYISLTLVVTYHMKSGGLTR